MSDNLKLDLVVELIRKAPEQELDWHLRRLLNSDSAELQAPTKHRSPRKAKGAPVKRALRQIGRGTSQEIVEAIRDRLGEPVPPNPADAVRWVEEALIKQGRSLRHWPDGSWSKFNFKPELVVNRGNS